MPRGRVDRRLAGVLLGLLAAALPAAAAAHDGQRELDAPADTEVALLLLGLGLLGTFVVISIGFLYRRQRGLRWDYQLPEGALSEGQGRDPDEEAH